MKRYKVDLIVGYTNGKYARETVCTFECNNETEAIKYAKGYMKLQHNMLDADMFFVYSVETI